MVTRPTPYGAYNFLVDIGDGDASSPLGGFSDVSGLGNEITLMEYRNGNDKENNVRKFAGLNKPTDVTLKRGIAGQENLTNWIFAMRRSQVEKRTVTITLNDEQGNPVMRWLLRNAQISKWTGPTLAAKGGSDVAMEEVVLASESIEFVDV